MFMQEAKSPRVTAHTIARKLPNARPNYCRKKLPITIATLLTLLVFAFPAHAAVFTCSGGNVQCLLDAIYQANANGQTNTIQLLAGDYALSDIDNTNHGRN